jgi:hypothetical protein
MVFKLSRHAREEMERRSISLPLLESVMDDPQQIVVERENLKAYQSVVDIAEKGSFLRRIIVDDAAEPPMVVTAYKTSKISKYWRTI